MSYDIHHRELLKYSNAFSNERLKVGGQEIIEFNFSTQRVTAAAQVSLICNAFTISNKGTSTLTINRSITLAADEKLEMGTDNWFEIIRTRVTLTFSGGGTNQAEIIQLVSDHPEISNYVGHGELKNS